MVAVHRVMFGMNRVTNWLSAGITGDDPRGDAVRADLHRVAPFFLCAGFLFVVQVITGLLMMTVYSPSTAAAWGSVWYIQTLMPGGWFVRGVHLFASDAMIVVLFFAVARVVLSRAILGTLAVIWWALLVALGLVLAISLTGELLPWDQHGFWGTMVRSNILAKTPLIGPTLRTLLWGGDEMGNLTLARFHLLHVIVLPVLLAAVLWTSHQSRSQKRERAANFSSRGLPQGDYGIGANAFSSVKSSDAQYAGLSNSLIRAFALAAVAGLTWYACVYRGWTLLDAPADPGAADYPARPEWHTLFLYQWLKLFAGPTAEMVGAIVVPGAVIVALFLLPMIDRFAPGLGTRRLRIVLAGVLTMTAAALTLLAIRYDRDPSESRIAEMRAKYRNGEALTKSEAEVFRSYEFNRSREWAEHSARRAAELADLHGIPPSGPLPLLIEDPMTRGPVLFALHCASCHRFADHDGKGRIPLEPPTSSDLHGFANRAWIRELLADPMADYYFGRMKNPDGDSAHTRMAKWLADSRAELTNDEERKTFEDSLDAAAAYLEFESKHPGLFAKPKDDPSNEPVDPSSDITIAQLAALPSVDRANIQRGRKVFVERCNECHAYSGERTGTLFAPEMLGYGSVEWTKLMIAQPDHESRYRSSGRERARMPRFVDRLSDDEIELIATWLCEGRENEPKNDQ